MRSPAVRLTVLAGPTRPVPLPPSDINRLRSVDVTESDQQPAVFTLTFDAGRSASAGALDAPGMRDSPARIGARVVVVVTFGARTSILSDGIVTDIQLTPGDGPGTAALAITGEDVSYLLDREERPAQHPALDDAKQVEKLLEPYRSDGIKPLVMPAPTPGAPLPTDRTPSQRHTDLGYIEELAARHGFAAYVVPGPTPGISAFYWGPPIRGGPPQPTLSVNFGAETNVTGMSFHSDASAPIEVTGELLDRRSGEPRQIRVLLATRPPLAARPLRAEARRRRRIVRDATSDFIDTLGRAQAQVNRSDDCVTATGSVDGGRYRHVLRPRGLVGVRGAGWSYDGLWYVQQVVHRLMRGSYQQQVTLRREGHGSTVPALPMSGAP